MGLIRAHKKPSKLKQLILEERKQGPQTPGSVREYVTHALTPEISHLAISLLSTLRGFYDKHKDNPIKAKTNKRFKQGFRETLKAIDRGYVMI